jgi:uncharacterized protein (TIGR00255 family)
MKSMTGYGRAEAILGDGGDWVVAVELSGVNRKQTDIAVNLPNQLAALEPDVRKRLAAGISRGRITARVTVGQAGGGGASGESRLRFDKVLAEQYLDALRSVAMDSGNEVRAGDLLRAPGVFQLEEASVEPEEILPDLLTVVDEALVALVQMQEAEGKNLRADFEMRLNVIAETVQNVSARAPQVLVVHRENLRERLSKADLDVESMLDDERIVREVALFADRCDISEELTRIGSHLQQFRSYLDEATDSGEAVGRPLDFLCQEFNREFNTIGSKANDAEIARHVVALKTELEKIREQVQNVQ